MKLFSHTSIIYHSIRDDSSHYEPGDIITDKDTWFRLHSSARVVKEGVSKRLSRYIIAKMNSDLLNVGDKLATCHGQKFTVSKIVRDHELPTFICNDTGKRIKPHIIVASSSIHNRGTLGQIYEAWAGMECMGDPDFDPRTNTKYKICDPFNPSDYPSKMYNCHIVDNNKILMNKDGRIISADYGVCYPLNSLMKDCDNFCHCDIFFQPTSLFTVLNVCKLFLNSVIVSILLLIG